MRVEEKQIKAAVLIIIATIILVVSARYPEAEVSEKNIQANEVSKEQQADATQKVGNIFLYGEAHYIKQILDKEAELWENYYHENGMRHLFIEFPYYSAELLNEWMEADDDEFLDLLYEERNPEEAKVMKKFWHRIKTNCPETIFHGTDVGHYYDSIGARYLEHLETEGLKDSEKYKLAQENIVQGQNYYAQRNDVYRENMMVKNFIEAYDKLKGIDVMGIYGSAHTYFNAMDFSTGSIPCMANQLKEHYGDNINSEDLNVTCRGKEPLFVERMQVGGKEYEASYFGREDMSAAFPELRYREFWRLENAYEDFKDCEKTKQVLPYSNFLMDVEEYQVFIIDYMKADGSTFTQYYRTDGDEWNGQLVAREFIIE